MRVVGYVRVSTEQQAQEGVSLDAQRARIKAYCVSQAISLVDVIVDDGYSAKSLERPGLRAALRMLADGKADGIVVVKLDRLTRSVKDLRVATIAPAPICRRSIGGRLRHRRARPTWSPSVRRPQGACALAADPARCPSG
jgi:hypothetical protein